MGDINTNSVLALRDAIDNTKTIVIGNGTNVLTITNEYPIFGEALSKTFVMDNIITFSKAIPIGTEIYIKKDGVYLKTYTATSNIKNIYMSDILGVPKEVLYTKVNEVYEFSFVYDQIINNKVITGELIDFTYANIVVNQLARGLFELSDSNTLEDIPVDVNTCNFVITYEDYDESIKNAKLDLGNEQYINASFVTDDSTTPPISLVKLSHIDGVYNTEIDLIMDGVAINNYINLLRDFGRRMNQLNTIK